MNLGATPSLSEEKQGQISLLYSTEEKQINIIKKKKKNTMTTIPTLFPLDWQHPNYY